MLVDLRKRSNETKAIRLLRSMPFEFLLAAETLRGSMNRAVQSANAITKVHTRRLLSKPGNTGCSSLPSGKTGLTLHPRAIAIWRRLPLSPYFARLHKVVPFTFLFFKLPTWPPPRWTPSGFGRILRVLDLRSDLVS